MEKNISKAKVLVCDDSMMVRNKMKKLLTAYGFTQIFEASDGAQAVEKFADIVPDVTFMDIVMPELSGVEALKLIKTNSPDAVVISCYYGYIGRHRRQSLRGYQTRR